MPIGEILLSMAVRGAVGGGMRALLAQNRGVRDTAIDETCEQYPEMELKPSLQRWIASPAFDGAFARLQAGERGFEGELVGSFIQIGDFYLPDEEKRAEAAGQVVTAFLSNVVSKLYEGAQGIPTLASRGEQQHSETLHAIKQVKAELLSELRPAGAATVAVPADQDVSADSQHGEASVQVNSARSLFESGKVTAAHAILDLVRRTAEDLPDDIQYRLLTLLGSCALAAEAIEEGCAYLEEAYRLRPDDATALANAAVAAGLRGDPRRAVELARRSLDLEPRDSHAAAVLLGALWKAGEADQMEEFVAAEAWIADDPRCVLALARIRAEQQRFGEAVEFARWLVDDDADDPETHIVLAECQMLAVQAGLADQPIVECREAETRAAKALALLENTDLEARVLHALSIRAGARLFVGDTTGAMADVETVLRRRPGDSPGLYNKGLILLETDDFPGARTTFDSIGDPDTRARALVPHAASTLGAGDRSGAVALLRGSFSLDRRDWDDIGKAELLGEAEYALGGEDSVGPLLDEALQRRPQDPRLLYLAARRHALRGEGAAAETSFLRAIERSGESDRNKIGLGLAAFYSQQEQYSNAADQYGQVVNGDVLHPGALELLRNLQNCKRLREALDWARTVREQHPHPPKPTLDTEAQILNYVGDVGAAAERRDAICSRDDATPQDRLKLAYSLLWRGDRERALATVRDIDASELRDEPRDFLGLAQLKRLLGESEYLEDAYAARRYGISDASVHLGYFGLFMSKEDELGTPETVEPGCAVLIRRDSREEWWLILEEGEERLSDHDLRSGEDLAVALLGHRRGDEVALQEGVGELSVAVVEIQSKYVRAFQETTSQFPERFPGNTDITSVAVAPDDMTSIFKVVDDRDRFARELQRLYRDDQVPFAFLCAYLGRPAPELWQACTAGEGLRIRFGAGAEAETDRARNALCESDDIVLDMLALLTIHELGLVEHLRRRFRHISVPQSVLDELRQLLYETTLPKRPQGQMGKNLDGSYSWAELSDDEWAKQAGFARSLLELAESLEAMPSYPVLDAEPDTLEVFKDALGDTGVAAIFAGGEDPRGRPLLVSDDLGLATLASVFGTEAVNTQAVLLELRRSGELTDEQYSASVARIAQMHYRFVRVEPADIHRLLEANGYMTDDASRALIATLEGPECSLESAVRVVSTLIAAIGLQQPPTESFIVPALLATLHRGREMTTALWECRTEIDRLLGPNPPVNARVVSLVDQWIAVWIGGARDSGR